MTKRELWRKHRTRLLPMLAALMIFVGIVFCGQVQETVESTPVDSWGKSVDGLAGRLIVTPRCAVGQAISVVIEIKNTSNKRRYFVPRLDPLASEWLTVGVSGPNGELRQGMRAAGYHTEERDYQPIEPGEIKRSQIFDLRRYFIELEPWEAYPKRTGKDVVTGKYTLRFQFRSPELVAASASEDLQTNQWLGPLTSAPVTFNLQPLDENDLVVHEWGVFKLFKDPALAAVDRKREWDSLPSFFYRQLPKERLRWNPGSWLKPIVYFYAKAAPLHLSVNVSFTHGAPVIWWPAVADPIDDGGRQPNGKAERSQPFRSLTWDAWVGNPGPMSALEFGPWNRDKAFTLPAMDFPLPKDCWLQQARLPEASRLTVVGTKEGPRTAPWLMNRPETEGFLYYDGLVPAPDYLSCEQVDETSLRLHNRSSFAIRRLFVVDRRVEGKTRFAALDKLLQPNATRPIALRSVAAADWPAAGAAQFKRALLDTGLYETEAGALQAIWNKDLLEGKGITVFYILPRSEYNRMLPLDILPAPAVKPVRVGIAVHPQMQIEQVRDAHSSTGADTSPSTHASSHL
jgi:hypothetical protein